MAGGVYAAMKVFLDLESVPPEKDDHVIGDRVGQMTDEEYRALALNGEYGRLLCIGLIIEQDHQIVHRGVLGRDRATLRFHLDEQRTLRAFWKLLGKFNPNRDLLIGCNLLDFDLHFLCLRSIIKGVKPSFQVSFARYRSRPIYDVMWEFEHWRHRISLHEMANILGIESSKRDGINGGAVYDLFLQGCHQEIADYCLRDVEVTRSIYYRMNFLDELVN